MEEIKKISNTLAPDEQVLFVAKQLRNIPGGALISSPNIVFATDKRLVIKNPTMLGLRENMESIPYDKITSVKLEKGLFSSPHSGSLFCDSGKCGCFRESSLRTKNG